MINYVQLDQRCINTIRALFIYAIQRAHFGHLGTPMGADPVEVAAFSLLRSGGV